MATYDINDYKKWDNIDYSAPEEEKLELDYNIDSDGEPPEDQIGDIRNVIRNKNEKIVRKEILKVGSGLEKPGKPYIVTVHALGYTKSNFEFLPLVQNINMTLGDLRLPTGLWKSIEHMKKGECSKIWIKPGEYGFGRSKHQDVLQWPELVRDNEELKDKLRNEEIYYEIEIVDWIVRADILGDGNLVKNYEVVSKGYDRIGDNDDVLIDYKIIRLDSSSQKHTIEESTDESISMLGHDSWGDIANTSKFTFSFSKVLKSMKIGEKSNTIVIYGYLKNKDQKAIEKYNLSETDRLIYDIEAKKMLKVEDFYNDGTVYRKVLRKGDSTASPFSDSWVKVQMKVAYKQLSTDQKEEVLLVTKEPLKYTLNEFTFPPLLREILKTTKIREVAEIHTILKDECIPEFEDEYGYFKKSWFDKVGEVDEKTGETNWIIFTMEMVDFDTPEAMHALDMKDKLPRLLKMKEIATRFFKAQNWPKACKIYQKIYSHYSIKDIFNNLHKEDETTPEYIGMKEDLEKLQLTTLTNILVVKSKLGDWKDIIEMSDKALKLDSDNIKALFFRGKAYLNLQEFDQATQMFNKILKLDQGNKEAAKELVKTKKEIKKYEEKSRAMFKLK